MFLRMSLLKRCYRLSFIYSIVDIYQDGDAEIIAHGIELE